MNCPNCNTLVGEGIANCPNCGLAMATTPTPEPLPNPVEQEIGVATLPVVDGETPTVEPAPVSVPDLTMPEVAPAETDAPAVNEVVSETIPDLTTPQIEVGTESVELAAPQVELTPPQVEVAPVAEAPAPAEDAYKVNTELEVPTPTEPVAASLQITPAPEVAPVEAAVTPEGQAVVNPTIAAIEPVTEETTEAPVAPQKKSKLPLLILLLFLLVVAAAVVLYTRGFFDEFLGKNKNVTPEPNPVVDNTPTEEDEPQEPAEETSIKVAGYEFDIPSGYTYAIDNGEGHLKNEDGTKDILISKIYSGQKEELKNIGTNARSEIEKAGYTFESSRSGTRNAKDYLHIGYIQDGNKYELLFMMLGDNNVLELKNLKPAGLNQEDFIQLGSDLINTKLDTSAPETNLSPLSEALVFTANNTY